MYTIEVRSGGQSGVDRAALDAAIAQGIPYGGWCPRGGIAEDFPSPPGVLARYPYLRETPSSESDERTAWNVRDSDATLILVRGTRITSPGTAFTRQCAAESHRPYRIVNLDAEASPADTLRWLRDLAPRDATQSFVLNVAGPRESQSPGVYTRALAFMLDLLRSV